MSYWLRTTGSYNYGTIGTFDPPKGTHIRSKEKFQQYVSLFYIVYIYEGMKKDGFVWKDYLKNNSFRSVPFELFSEVYYLNYYSDITYCILIVSFSLKFLGSKKWHDS